MPVSKGVSSWVSAHVSEVKTCQDLFFHVFWRVWPRVTVAMWSTACLCSCFADCFPFLLKISQVSCCPLIVRLPCRIHMPVTWGSDHVRTTGRCPSTHISKFHKVKRFHSSSAMLHSLQPMSSWRDSACDDSPWIVHREGVHWCLCSMLHGMLFCSHEKSWELWMFFPPAICYEHVWNIALDPSPKWVSSGVIKHGWLENPPFIIINNRL